MNKKKLITTSLAVMLAVALAAGGTLAYLNGNSITATNVVENDFNWVSLTETDTSGEITKDSDGNITNTGYEIIPGTSQAKNPTVSVSYSLDSYVYVEVTDSSDGLITWKPAEGWTLLSNTTNSDGSVTSVYYRFVDETNYTESATSGNVLYYKNCFDVLDGKSISYNSSITNENLVEEFDEDGDPSFVNENIRLTFQAYIMQADISGPDGVNETALECWYALAAEKGLGVATINGALYGSLNEAISAAADNDTITLLADTTESVTLSENITITIDLNGYTLTKNTGSYALWLKAGKVTLNDSSSDETGTISGGVCVGRTSETVYDYESIYYGSPSSIAFDVLLYAAELTMNGGTITGGTRGVYVNGGTFIMNGGTISYNSNTTVYTAGVYVYGAQLISLEDVTRYNNYYVVVSDTTQSYTPPNYGTFTMNGGTISNNSATGSNSEGGGVMADAFTNVSINGGTIKNNWAYSKEAVSLNGNYSITGGTFDQDVSIYLAEGYEQTNNDDGTYTVSAITQTENE